MTSAISGLAIALAVSLAVLTVAVLQHRSYSRAHQQQLRRIAALHRLATPPTTSQRDRVGNL